MISFFSDSKPQPMELTRPPPKEWRLLDMKRDPPLDYQSYPRRKILEIIQTMAPAKGKNFLWVLERILGQKGSAVTQAMWTVGCMQQLIVDLCVKHDHVERPLYIHHHAKNLHFAMTYGNRVIYIISKVVSEGGGYYWMYEKKTEIVSSRYIDRLRMDVTGGPWRESNGLLVEVEKSRPEETYVAYQFEFE